MLKISGDPHQDRNKHTNHYVITSSTPEWYATSVTYRGFNSLNLWSAACIYCCIAIIKK